MNSLPADAVRHPTMPSGVSVAIDPVALVITECITVTSAMRKHARWAHSSVSAILGGGAPSAKLDTKRPSFARADSSSSKMSRERPKVEKESEDAPLASRWGLRGKKGQSMQDNPLLSAFAKLRSDLKRCKNIHTVDAPAILHPFLQVIRSSSTSAPITSLALIAITKFFAYGIISTDSPQLPLGMQMLSSAVTHCRFEASDSATDEIVLFRILKLMEWMITGSGGEVLGDESMCEMMETGISMCCQTRLSELLRRSAEVSMVTMCQTIFQRLKKIEVTEEEEEAAELSRVGSAPDSDGVKMDPTANGDIIPTSVEEENSERSSESLEANQDKGGEKEVAELNGETAQPDLSQKNLDQAAEIKPYGLPSIRELFRVLVDLLDPHDKQHNDTMRVMALRIVDVALEVAGPSIANHPSLAALAKDTLCRHLFQLVRSENIAILNESLRVAGTLISTCRRVLKLQQELYLSYLVACLHPRVEIPQETGIDPALYAGVPQAPRLARAPPSQTSSGRSTPVPIKDRQRLGMEGGLRKPDAREAMVEGVGGLVRIPSFMAELFINYDCDIDRSDLCLDLVGLLSRNAFPDAATWSTTNVPPLCLDALLGYIQTLADRVDDEPSSARLPSRTQLQEQRTQKKIIIRGANKFNENPKSGISFLAAQNLIDNPDDPKSIAQFLTGTSRLDKKVIGEWISKKSNEIILTSFMDTFDFVGVRVDEALRQLLNSFRLPGEAPLIARIVNEFSAKYFSDANPPHIADKDALYVLTYAIIMLNTDQHNPNVKSQNRMTFIDFSKNLRGVNNGQDFNSEFLQEIYDSIRNREIILAEEHDNKHSFDHAWKELLDKVQDTSGFTTCDTNFFDADMFAATWKPVVATLSYVFMSATDDTVFSRVVTGFDQCAQIAAKYGVYDALDHIIFCLSSISSLASDTAPSTALNTEVQAGEKSVMVSETAVRFGRDFKAQLATVVLFRVVINHESAIRDGWNHLVLIILNLFVNSLINAPYTSISSHADLPPIPLQSPAQVIERGDKNTDGGLFSAFTSYVSSFANDEPPEPSDQEIEYTLCTVDAVNSCSFGLLFTNITQMPIDALKSFVQTLLARLPEDNSPSVIVVKPDIPAPKAVRPNSQKPKQVGVTYDPSIVFILEFCTILAARDPETISAVGKDVGDALQSVVRDAAHTHPVTLTRAVYYLLSLLRASHDHGFLRVPVVLHTISKLDSEVVKQASGQLVKGISLCLTGPPALRNEMVNSPDFWSVLQALHSLPEASQIVFDIITGIAEGSSPALTADNYEPAISLLNDFATAGSVGAATESNRDEPSRRGRGQKPRGERAERPEKEKPNEVVIRGIKAMQLVSQLTSRTPSFIQQSQLEPKEAWSAYWSPPFRTLTTHSLNPCRPIRSQALTSLQRVLLSPSLASSATNSVAQSSVLFTDVLFPLIGQLLKPEVWHSDPSGMGETRLQAAVLTCKVFLQFLDVLLVAPSSDAKTVESQDDDEDNESPGRKGLSLWSRILEIMERLVKSGGQNDGMEDAVPETLKNIILVMANGGYMASTYPDPNATPLQKRLYEESAVRLERFLPGLMAQLFPDAEQVPPGVAADVNRKSSDLRREDAEKAAAERDDDRDIEEADEEVTEDPERPETHEDDVD